jgi:peptidoglycan/LPS O-acetylase OafA/YrhL
MMTTGSRAAGAAKLECYDSVRGLAALSVAVGHFVLGFWPGLYFRAGPAWDRAPGGVRAFYTFPGRHLLNGSLMVSLFFVVSGFVLALPYFRGGGPASLGSAATRRYFRLMLPVAFSIFLAYGLMVCGAMRSPEAVRRLDEAYGVSVQSAPRVIGETNGWLACYYNFSPSFPAAVREAVWGAFTAGAVFYDLPLYTMPDELAGSFLVFAFLALFGSLRNRGLLYGAVGGICLLAGRAGLLDFVVGMALCDVWWHNRERPRIVLSLSWALLIVAAAVCFVPGPTRNKTYLVMGAVVASPRLQTLLAASWLTRLGRISFGLYALHMPIFCSLGCGTYLYLGGRGWSHAAGTLTAAGAALTASLVAGWVFYHVIDRPTISLTRWLNRRFFRPTPPTAAPQQSFSHAA